MQVVFAHYLTPTSVVKKLLTYFVLSSSLVACQKDDSAGESVSATGFEVAHQKTASVSMTGAEAVQITLKNVTDSRCPSNVNCFWAGNVQTTIEIKTAAEPAQTADLCLGSCKTGKPFSQRDSTTVLVNSKPYWLHLTAVNPYPSASSDNTPKTASLRLVPQ